MPTGSGVVAYSLKIDQILAKKTGKFKTILHYEIGYNEVAELWQAYKSYRLKQTYVITLHDPPVIVGKLFSRWLKGSVLAKAVRKILDKTVGVLIIKKTLNGAGALIVLNKQAIPSLIAKWSLDPTKIHTSSHPIYLAKYVKVQKSTKLIQILFFGNIGPQKGIDTLIEALFKVLPDNLNLKVILIGRPTSPRMDKLVNTAAQNPVIKPQVEYWGYVGDEKLLSALADSDIVVLPYRSNGITHASGPLMAAMASGKAVVASDIDVFNGEIVNRENGLLFRSGDSKALSESINELLKNPKLINRLGSAARKHVIDKHNDEEIRKQLLEVYENL